MLRRVRLTEESIRWLHARRIFFEKSAKQPRLKPGDTIAFEDTARVEPYVGVLGGTTICTIGAFSYSWSTLPIGMTVGRYCSIAAAFTVPAPRHPVEMASTSSFTYDRGLSFLAAAVEDAGNGYDGFRPNPQKPMPRIGNDVWIGAGVAAMPGIAIGDGAVVAARSVVTKDVPSYAIVGGNPARVLRQRFAPEIVERMQRVAWWRYRFTDFKGIDISDPARFLDRLEAADDIAPYTPAPVPLAELPGTE